MKALVLVSVFLGFVSGSFAATVQVPVVGIYDPLEGEAQWKDIDQDEVPVMAIQNLPLEVPSRAYQSLEPGHDHSKIYLQNDRMIVCYESCDKPQPALPFMNNKIELKDLSANKYISGHQRDEAWKALKVLNVYFWTNKLFDHLASLGYIPSNRLMVIVDRKIAEPTVGKNLKNNAFFSDKDWSLNFLPAKNSFLYNVLGMNIHSPALDPSVAMHECAHSVFSELIGDILNPEIYGLHEAIADYFAMAVLGTRKIGIIFSSGEALRSTLEKEGAKKITYKPGMEAHDLGNVVNTALQYIRALVPQKQYADLSALWTIKDLGRNPYVLVTQVQASFNQSLASVYQSQNQALDGALQSQIQKVWTDYNILSPEKFETLPLSYFNGPEGISGYFEISTETRLTERAAADWGLPVVSSSKAKVLKVLPGPDMQIPGADKTISTNLILAEVESENKSTQIWVHLSSQGILGAYDELGGLILPVKGKNEGLFKVVMRFNELLEDVVEFRDHKSSMGTIMAGLFDHSLVQDEQMGLIRATSKMKDQRRQEVVFNSGSLGKINVIQRSGFPKVNLLGRLAKMVIGSGLGIVQEARIYTVKSSEYPQLKTQELFPGERFLGYEVKFKTGVSQRSMISDFDPDQNSSVLKKGQ